MFLKRRHSSGQQEYKKMLNVTHHSRNANQNHSERAPTTVRMAAVKKTKTNICW
jgi:hypothetical protein